MDALFCLILLLAAMAGQSNATYCLCKDGMTDSALQKALDYACGNGADCSQIQQNGACYLPNSIKDHCSFAVNSYYQKKIQSGATCNFSATASTSQTLPNVASGCVYPSSSSAAGTTPTPPSSTTNSNTSYGTTPTFGTGISPSGTSYDENGSRREAINFFNAMAALVCWSVGFSVWG